MVLSLQLLGKIRQRLSNISSYSHWDHSKEMTRSSTGPSDSELQSDSM